jgi:tryptophanyl-tRNA synthetase
LTDVINEWRGKTQYGEFKQVVAQIVFDWLNDFQNRLAQIDEAKLLAKLEESEEAMRQQAGETLLRVQQAVGLRQK